ncbi:Protein ATC1/LIC4 [Dirofilaria immitis]
MPKSSPTNVPLRKSQKKSNYHHGSKEKENGIEKGNRIMDKKNIDRNRAMKKLSLTSTLNLQERVISFRNAFH